jgi:type II secretory pathway pseudopilin PulG
MDARRGRGGIHRHGEGGAMSGERGYVLIELLVGAAITCAISVLLLQLAIGAQRVGSVQSEVSDEQQRLRVAAEAIRHDLVQAGAGVSQGAAMGPLNAVFPPVLPARIGVMNRDPELTVRADRFSVLSIPETRSQTLLRSAMASTTSPLAIEGASPGCVAGTACEFAVDDRAVIYDRPGDGTSFDLFTVAAVDIAANLITPSAPLSKAYGSAARVARITIRNYYFDSANRRLMLYDGNRSDLPLVDHVTGLRVAFVGDGGVILDPTQFGDGPFLGTPPNRFDADLLRVRRVRVTIGVEPGSPAYSVRDLSTTIDVAPPNMEAR